MHPAPLGPNARLLHRLRHSHSEDVQVPLHIPVLSSKPEDHPSVSQFKPITNVLNNQNSELKSENRSWKMIQNNESNLDCDLKKNN